MEKRQRLDVQTMALRAAKEFKDGDVINLGIGVPTLASNFVPVGREVLFHTGEWGARLWAHMQCR